VDPLVNLISAVVGNGAESHLGESSEFRDVISAVTGTVEVNFDGLKLSKGLVEVVPSGNVGGVVVKGFEALEEGGVGIIALGVSVGEILPVEAGSLEVGGVLSVVGKGIVQLGEGTNVLLVLPEEGVGIDGALGGGKDFSSGGVDSINLKEITGGVVALPGEVVFGVVSNLGGFNSDVYEDTGSNEEEESVDIGGPSVHVSSGDPP